MGTKIFDTVQVYTTPGTTSINLVANRLHSINLAAFGAVGNVACNFPVGTEVGQAIGLSLLTGSAAATLGIGTGSAQFPFSMQNADECALFSWSGLTWTLVSKWTDAPTPNDFYAQNFSSLDGPFPIVITHNLGSNSPIEAVFDDSGVRMLLGTDYTITRIDADSLSLDVLTVIGTNAWQIGLAR